MLDRETVRVLRDRMQTALDPLGRELNVKFLVGNASYTADNVRFKVEATTSSTAICRYADVALKFEWPAASRTSASVRQPARQRPHLRPSLLREKERVSRQGPVGHPFGHPRDSGLGAF